jgi:plastocyanin/FtsP/CotA-like multicopper oxidase with cupredoxin domain
MARLEFWIQLENHPWDICPHGRDRMSGQAVKDKDGVQAANVTLVSPGTNHQQPVNMNKPLRDPADDDPKHTLDALILRRYLPPRDREGGQPARAPWSVPDDHKVNPWDLNELDPTDNGTMGTIPGPVIEAKVGDKVIVHFRNLDMRKKWVWKTEQVKQKVTEEWQETGEHRGDPQKGHHQITTEETVPKRVLEQEDLEVEMRTHSLHPHGFVFAATSDGAYPLSPPDSSQPITAAEASTWSTAEKDPGQKFKQGDGKKGDRVPPGGTFDYTWVAGAPGDGDSVGPWPSTAGVWLYHDHSICDMENVLLGAIGIIVIHNPNDPQEVDIRKSATPSESDPAASDLDPAQLPGGSPTGPVTKDKPRKTSFPPPTKALYLQLFHELTGAGGAMLINGRQYLGNTPTLISGPTTLMRFGVVGMAQTEYHTFHIHGHRWVIPGPDGTNPGAIQSSPQITAVSQFEDTRIFGAANSFVFAIQQGSFMGTSPLHPEGEYHMHCHVLGHMDMGMMGSLLIVEGDGGPVVPLPEGIPCPAPPSGMAGMDDGMAVQVDVQRSAAKPFSPDPVIINKGQTVHWINHDSEEHTATSDTPGQFDVDLLANQSGKHQFIDPGTFPYHCKIHPTMQGTVIVNPP